VDYLRHVVSGGGVSPDPKKIKHLVGIAPPTTAKLVRSFLGFTGYYRCFVRHYAEIAAPLHALLHKDTLFQWSHIHQEAFEQLVKAISTVPVLAYPDFSKPFILQPDACKCSIDAVLSQIRADGLKHPVAFFSRLLGKYELSYSVSELECLALLEGMRYYRPYL
jgi:hypothetical protein